jgi:hypothetical protein
MRAHSLSLAATACLVAACRTAAPAASSSTALESPGLSAERLMEACWEPGPPPQARVQLQFFTEDEALKEVRFDAVGGASPTVGRCAREVALSYPWPPGRVPERLELAPPRERTSGWAKLAYVALLAEDRARARVAAGGTEGAEGLRSPGPLVHACLRRGEGPQDARFRVRTYPTRVDVELEDAKGSVTYGEPRTRAQRCVAAVLGATVWPNRRGHELDFSRREDAPPPAPPEAVARYFPEDTTRLPPLGPDVVQEAMTRLRPAVSICWEAALRRRPELHGGRSVQLVVDADGGVQAAAIAENSSDVPEEAADYLLDGCLLGALGQLRFQPPGSGPSRATYSWVFAHR